MVFFRETLTNYNNKAKKIELEQKHDKMVLVLNYNSIMLCILHMPIIF